VVSITDWTETERARSISVELTRPISICDLMSVLTVNVYLPISVCGTIYISTRRFWARFVALSLGTIGLYLP